MNQPDLIIGVVSVIRGGHFWLRLRVSARKPLNHGKKTPNGPVYGNPDPPPSLDLLDPGLQSGPLVRDAVVRGEQRRKLIAELM